MGKPGKPASIADTRAAASANFKAFKAKPDTPPSKAIRVPAPKAVKLIPKRTGKRG